ncbi:MAG: GAF domain-containing protein [Armatimonadota bacterium]
MISISQEEMDHLQERIGKLAREKSQLQLIVSLMSRISAVPGLDNTIDSVLKGTMDVVGGTNITLYYKTDNELFYTDVLGKKMKVDKIDDTLVRKVFETRKPIESELPFEETKMIAPEFSKAYTWVFPLIVADDLIGVFKLENLHIGMREFRRQLPIFFDYAALILRNEILSASRLKQAYDQLRAANSELTKSKEELEMRVAERTAELESELAERKKAEEALQKANRILRMLSGVNEVLVRAAEESTLLNETCRIVVEVGGYRMAWIGFAEHDPEKTVRPVAHAGYEEGYLDTVKISWADTELGRGPSGTAILTGKPSFIRDIATEPSFAPWRGKALKRGYKSSISIP